MAYKCQEIYVRYWCGWQSWRSKRLLDGRNGVKVPGNDQRRETHEGIEAWERVVEHDIDTRVGQRPFQPRKEDLHLAEGQTVLFHCLRAHGRNGITHRTEQAE